MAWLLISMILPPPWCSVECVVGCSFVHAPCTSLRCRYMHRVPGMKVLLLTNDADNKRKAEQEGINAMTVQVWGGLSPTHALDLIVLEGRTHIRKHSIQCPMPGEKK